MNYAVLEDRLPPTIGLDYIATPMSAHAHKQAHVMRVVRRGRGVTVQLWAGGTGCLASQVSPSVDACLKMVGQSTVVLQAIDLYVKEVPD